MRRSPIGKVEWQDVWEPGEHLKRRKKMKMRVEKMLILDIVDAVDVPEEERRKNDVQEGEEK